MGRIKVHDFILSPCFSLILSCYIDLCFTNLHQKMFQLSRLSFYNPGNDLQSGMWM